MAVLKEEDEEEVDDDDDDEIYNVIYYIERIEESRDTSTMEVNKLQLHK